MNIEELRSYLRDYVLAGMSSLCGVPTIAMLGEIDSADSDRLLSLAYSWGLLRD